MNYYLAPYNTPETISTIQLVPKDKSLLFCLFVFSSQLHPSLRTPIFHSVSHLGFKPLRHYQISISCFHKISPRLCPYRSQYRLHRVQIHFARNGSTKKFSRKIFTNMPIADHFVTPCNCFTTLKTKTIFYSTCFGTVQGNSLMCHLHAPVILLHSSSTK